MSVNTALKNRLVGTIIVVALAVIFLPEYLDGKKRLRDDVQVTIPTAPTVQASSMTLVKPAPEIADAVKLPETSVTNLAEQNSITEAETDVSQTVKADIPKQAIVEKVDDSLATQTILQTSDPEESAGWVIQLGSFKHQKNVRELIQKVEKAGYRTFSSPIQTPAGELTKVFVGPDTNKSTLEDALPHLREVTGLAGRITPFTSK